MKHHPETCVICCIVVAAVSLAAGCAPPEVALGARQVLARAVDNLVSLQSYRYRGTSTMTAAGDARLDSKASFDTVLQQNRSGGLDGHMVVKSSGYSYETYSWSGTEYTRVEGAGWTRAAKGEAEPGYGMVSTDARQIITRFADLVEGVKFTGRAPGYWTVAMTMGEKYRSGAAAIAGAPAASGAGRNTEMTLTISKKDFTMRTVVMKDASEASGSAPAITIVTRGTYSAFNDPTDLRPPAAAFEAPLVSAQEAPPTQQPQ